MNKLLLALFSLIFISSCSDKNTLEREDFIGNWAVRYNEEFGDRIIDEFYKGDRVASQCCAIIFDDDGTFIQDLGERVKGEWQIEIVGAKKRFVLIYPDKYKTSTDWHNSNRTSTDWHFISRKCSDCNIKIDLNMLILTPSGEYEERTIPIYH